MNLQQKQAKHGLSYSHRMDPTSSLGQPSFKDVKESQSGGPLYSSTNPDILTNELEQTFGNSVILFRVHGHI